MSVHLAEMRSIFHASIRAGCFLASYPPGSRLAYSLALIAPLLRRKSPRYTTIADKVPRNPTPSSRDVLLSTIAVYIMLLYSATQHQLLT